MTYIQMLEKYRYTANGGKKIGIRAMCRKLGVNASTYYRWLDGDVPVCSRGRCNRAIGAVNDGGNVRVGDVVYLIDSSNDTMERLAKQ